MSARSFTGTRFHSQARCCAVVQVEVDGFVVGVAAGTDWGVVWAMAIGTAISPATASTAAATPTLREVFMFVSSRHRRGHPGT